MWQFDKCSGCFSHLLMCVHGPVEMRPLWKWPLSTVHLSDFSPYSTSTTLHLEREIPVGFVSFIAVLMFIKTSAVAMYISVLHIVSRLVTIFFCKKLTTFLRAYPNKSLIQTVLAFSYNARKQKSIRLVVKLPSIRCHIKISQLSTCHSCSCLYFHRHVMSFIRQECLSKMCPHSSRFKQSAPMGIHYTRIGNWRGIVFLFIMVGCVIQAICN